MQVFDIDLDDSSSKLYNHHLHMGPQEEEEEEMHYISNNNKLKGPDNVAELLLLKDPDKGLELVLHAIKTKKYCATIRCKEAG